MNQKDARREFKATDTTWLREMTKPRAKRDKPAIRFAWSCFIDHLVKSGQTAERYATNWGQIIPNDY
jgi:hypothetical protein